MSKTSDDNQIVTKKILVDTLLDLWENHFLPELNKKADKSEVKEGFARMDSQFTEVKSLLKDHNRRIRDLEADTPTLSQHRALTKRVSALESAIPS